MSITVIYPDNILLLQNEELQNIFIEYWFNRNKFMGKQSLSDKEKEVVYQYLAYDENENSIIIRKEFSIQKVLDYCIKTHDYELHYYNFIHPLSFVFHYYNLEKYKHTFPCSVKFRRHDVLLIEEKIVQAAPYDTWFYFIGFFKSLKEISLIN